MTCIMKPHLDHMRLVIVVAVLLSVVSPASAALAGRARGKMEGNTYVSPLGDFRCEVPYFDLGETKINDGFGPHGGTAAFNGFFDITRIDVEEFEPKLADAELVEPVLEQIYSHYFDEQMVPLVRSGVKNASVVSQEFRSGDPSTYVSVMKLPQRSSNGGDMLRGAVEYTNGKFMYVVSVSRSMQPEKGWSEKQDADEVSKQSIQEFARCRFPSAAHMSEQAKP